MKSIYAMPGFLGVVFCGSLVSIVLLSASHVSAADPPPPDKKGEAGEKCNNNFMTVEPGASKKTKFEEKKRVDVPDAKTAEGKKKIQEELKKMKKKNPKATEKQAKDKLIEEKKLCVDTDKECKNGGSLRYRDIQGETILLCADQCNKGICEKGKNALDKTIENTPDPIGKVNTHKGGIISGPIPEEWRPPAAREVGVQAMRNAWEDSAARPEGKALSPDRSTWSPEMLARESAINELEALAAGQYGSDDWERDQVPRYEGKLAHEWKDKMAELEAKAEPRPLDDPPVSKKEKKSFEDVTSTFGKGNFDPAQAKKAGNLWDLFTKGTKGGSGNFPSYQERKGWLNTFAKDFVLKSGEVYKGTAAQNTRLLRAIKQWLFGQF